MRSMKITMLIWFPLALFYVFTIVFQTKADNSNNNNYYYYKKLPQQYHNWQQKNTQSEQQRKAGVSKSFVRNAFVLFQNNYSIS